MRADGSNQVRLTDQSGTAASRLVPERQMHFLRQRHHRHLRHLRDRPRRLKAQADHVGRGIRFLRPPSAAAVAIDKVRKCAAASRVCPEAARGGALEDRAGFPRPSPPPLPTQSEHVGISAAHARTGRGARAGVGTAGPLPLSVSERWTMPAPRSPCANTPWPATTTCVPTTVRRLGGKRGGRTCSEIGLG